MLHLNDIVRAITLKMSNLEIPIYAKEVKEGFRRPGMFIDVYPIDVELQTRYVANVIVQAVITIYTDDSIGASNNNLLMGLRKDLGYVLSVNDRNITIKSYEIQDAQDRDNDVFIVSFELDYYESITEDEEYEFMQDILYRTVIHD